MLTKDTFIAWPYKIVTGKQGGKGIWTGTRSPNATKVKDDDPGCGSMPDDLDDLASLAGLAAPGPCLFQIEQDPVRQQQCESVSAIWRTG
eukprot:COSAG01_NODE_615_length_14818_cov_9.454039_12_plen_90_part_00